MSADPDFPLRLEDVTQRYGRTTVLHDVSLGIERGEFVTLLGPSGCGKTTLLRIVAGFLTPTAGRVVLDGRDVSRVPPHKRPVNMVFQRPTLFPHLSVADNVGFGLRIAGMPKDEIRRRVDDALRLARLDGFGPRRSHELSGGQMQRVALARAIVNRPKVLLFDEPLSALDLKIRLDMEVELRRVHRETGATTVYVTHDQREALALSDRIAVLSDGRIEQIGAPDEIYRAPVSPFVARFVGDSNLLPVDIGARNGHSADVSLCGTTIAAPLGRGTSDGPAWLVVRPENIRLGTAGRDGTLSGVVQDMAFRGTGFTYRVEIPGVRDLLKAEMAASSDNGFAVGDTVSVHWDPDGCRLLPRGAEDARATTATAAA